MMPQNDRPAVHQIIGVRVAVDIKDPAAFGALVGDGKGLGDAQVVLQSARHDRFHALVMRLRFRRALVEILDDFLKSRFGYAPHRRIDNGAFALVDFLIIHFGSSK
jgi:hypothetical protein